MISASVSHIGVLIGDAVAGPHHARVSAGLVFEELVDINVSLAPGQVATRNVSGQFVISPASGDTGEICLAADEPANVVEESNELNNTTCINF